MHSADFQHLADECTGPPDRQDAVLRMTKQSWIADTEKASLHLSGRSFYDAVEDCKEL